MKAPFDPVQQVLKAIPPFMNMRASDLATLIQVFDDAKFHALRYLKEACAKEGHKWDKAEGVSTCVRAGHYTKEMTRAPDDLGDKAEYDDVWVPEEYALVRTCTRCGAKQRGEAKTVVLKQETRVDWR